jgi:hypothetical protein
MRFIVDVNTIGKLPEDVRASAVQEIDKIIEKSTLYCSECWTPFLSERRERKKYCRPECRSDVSTRNKMKRYYEKKKKVSCS